MLTRKTPLKRKTSLRRGIAKKTSRKKLVKTLDSIFSKYIRLRDSDSDGICACVTCGARKLWKEQQAGHYVSRSNYATRWDERNVHAQCYACNIARSGNMPEYALFIQRTYGRDMIETLVITGKRVRKFRNDELKAMIVHYQGEVAKWMKEQE